MDYLNEENFKDLDKFIETCTDTSAAIGDVDSVLESIDEMFMIPVRSTVVYVGELHPTNFSDLERLQELVDMGVALSTEEQAEYDRLVAENNAN